MPVKGLGGSTPQIVRNPEGVGIKRLFFSQREIALIKDKTVAPGFGVLAAGTVMAVNSSAAGNKGQLVPYAPLRTKITANTASAIGVTLLVQDAATNTLKVSISDSYRFVVGDELIVNAITTGGEQATGAITVIDRTTDPRWATITAILATVTNLTVANTAYCYVKAAAATPFTTAFSIIDKDIDTGYGESAAGALTSIVISNAIVYTGSLVNATSEALTSLGAVQDGQHTILK
jgi:hypothetical protein